MKKHIKWKGLDLPTGREHNLLPFIWSSIHEFYPTKSENKIGIA